MPGPDEYLNTISRLEPDVAMIDSGAGFASIAISLKRIADELIQLRGLLYDLITELRDRREIGPWP